MINMNFTKSATVYNLSHGVGVNQTHIDDFINTANPVGRGPYIPSDMSSVMKTVKVDTAKVRTIRALGILPHLIVLAGTAGYAGKHLLKRHKQHADNK